MVPTLSFLFSGPAIGLLQVELEGAKNEAGKKAAEAGAREGGGGGCGDVTVVLKMDMHCEGCAKKVRRAVRRFEGEQRIKLKPVTRWAS